MWSIQTYTLGGPLILHGTPALGDGTTHGTADLIGEALYGIHIGILEITGIGEITGGIILTAITSILPIIPFTVRYIIRFIVRQQDLEGMCITARETVLRHTKTTEEVLLYMVEDRRHLQLQAAYTENLLKVKTAVHLL